MWLGLLLSLLFSIVWSDVDGAVEGLVPFTGTATDLASFSGTLVVGTLDGTVFGLNSMSGEVEWSFTTGSKIFSSSHWSIIPGIDGAIHVDTTEGMREHPTNIKKLVDQSPMVLDDDIIYIGEKHTNLFIIDPKTGKVRTCYKDSANVAGCEVPAHAVFLGRVDYTVKAVDPVTHQERWNLTLGEYTTVFEDQLNQTIFNRTALVSNVDGELMLIDSDGKELWTSMLASPVVYHHFDAPSQMQLFFQEQVLIPDTKVFIGFYEGALFGLPVANVSHSASNQLEDLHPILVQSNDSWIHTIKRQLLERNSGAHQLVPYVGRECFPNSALYPMCLHGAHDRVCHKSEEPLIDPDYSVPIAIGLGGLLLIALGWKLSRRREGPKEEKKPIVTPKKPKQPKKKPIVLPPSPVTAPPPHANMTTIGHISVDLDAILGYGSSGTVVYQGLFEGRKVAVKRMLIHFTDLAKQEIDILIGSDEHPNILRYFAKEEDSEFVYLALSYCPMTLEDLIQSKKFKTIKPSDIVQMLIELVEGIHHLHSLNIVHRDLKPQNILVDYARRVKISDMGIARRLNQEQNSFSTDSKGTFGWQAPEVILSKKNEKTRHTKSVDIFSLGCIIHYILTGSHPFGDPFEQQHRICTNKANLTAIKASHPLAYDLVSKCILKEPKKRPSISQVKEHIFFWDNEKKLQFTLDVSDKLEFEKASHPLVVAFEKDSSSVIGTDWTKPFEPELLRDLKRYRKYDYRKLRDLLRVIRNKSNHFRDLPVALQRELGQPPAGFLSYFVSRFPNLLTYIYNFIYEHCKEETPFSSYITTLAKSPHNTTSSTPKESIAIT